jgi:hypothetical protein
MLDRARLVGNGGAREACDEHIICKKRCFVLFVSFRFVSWGRGRRREGNLSSYCILYWLNCSSRWRRLSVLWCWSASSFDASSYCPAKYTSILSNNHLVQHQVSFRVLLPKALIGVGLLATSVVAVKDGGASETEEDSNLQKSLRGLAKSLLESSDSNKVREVSIVLMCY